MIRAPISTPAPAVLVHPVQALHVLDGNTLIDRGPSSMTDMQGGSQPTTLRLFHVRTLNASGNAALLINQPDNAVEGFVYGSPRLLFVTAGPRAAPSLGCRVT